MTCKDQIRIDKRLLPTKSSYFFALAGVGSLLLYVPVYMRQLGLSASETAINYGLMPFLGFLIRPIIGLIADKLQGHKSVLMICMVLTGAVTVPMLFVPPRGLPQPRNTDIVHITLLCTEGQSQLLSCEKTQLVSKRCGADYNSTQNAFSSSSICSLNCQKSTASVVESKLCMESYHRVNNATCLNTSEVSFSVTLSSVDEQTKFSYSGENLRTVDSDLCRNYSVSSLTHQDVSYSSLKCETPQIYNCHTTFNSTSTDASNSGKNSKEDTRRFDTTFWSFFILYLLSQITFAPIFGLIDAIAYDFLGEERGKWGKQRLWGTIGFALFGLVSGFVMDSYNHDNLWVNYIFPFISYAVNMIIGSVCVCQMKISDQIKGQSFLKNMGKLLKRVEVSTFLLVMFIFGMDTGTVETFLYWHLQVLGARKVLFGLCMAMNCTAELVMLFFAGNIIKKIGQLNCLFLAFVAYAVRFSGVTFITNVWFVLPIELTHGLTFSLMYAGASGYGSYLTPPGMSGTIQGLISGLHFGIGKGVGSLLSGQLVEAFGVVTTFRSYAIANVVILILYVTFHVLFLRKRIKAFDQTRKERDKVKSDVELEQQENMLSHSEHKSDVELEQQENMMSHNEHKSDVELEQQENMIHVSHNEHKAHTEAATELV